MIESKRILRTWITASALWLAVPGFFLVSDWQKIGPPSAECADFAEQRAVGSRNHPLTEHQITCVNEALSPNAQLIADVLKLAMFPPVLVFAVGWVAIRTGNIRNRFRD